MSSPGEPDDLLAAARSALLDALDALGAHLDAVIVIGAQAVYLRTAGAAVAVAGATTDSDLAIDPRLLGDEPRIEDAMEASGFHRDATSGQPGAWVNPAGVPVDLMVPERLAGPGSPSSRGARIAPHHKHATRRARGLEAAVVDNELLVVDALRSDDPRRREVRVAGPAALIVAKAHKVGERAADAPDRLVDKDAHDLYRLLVATPTSRLVADFERLFADEVAGEVTAAAIALLQEHFAAGPEAIGSRMAGRTEEGIGEPATVARQTSILAADLVAALSHRPEVAEDLANAERVRARDAADSGRRTSLAEVADELEVDLGVL